MRNLLVTVVVLFILGVVAYLVSLVVGLGDLVATAVGFANRTFGDPYAYYVSLVASILGIIVAVTLLVIGVAVRRVGVEP